VRRRRDNELREETSNDCVGSKKKEEKLGFIIRMSKLYGIWEVTSHTKHYYSIDLYIRMYIRIGR